MNKIFNMERQTKYPRRYSDQFMKAQETLDVKREYPNAIGVKCLGLRRWEQPATAEKTFDWGQSMEYRIILPNDGYDFFCRRCNSEVSTTDKKSYAEKLCVSCEIELQKINEVMKRPGKDQI